MINFNCNYNSYNYTKKILLTAISDGYFVTIIVTYLK